MRVALTVNGQEVAAEVESLGELKDIGRAVGRLNKLLPKRQFILMGPGRWGSRGDIKLGVSVTYADINNTAMLIEIARRTGDYLPDLSFGTHFFQDLVEAGIGYLPLYRFHGDLVELRYKVLTAKDTEAIARIIGEDEERIRCLLATLVPIDARTIKAIGRHADGAIVGSALVEVLERGDDPQPFLKSLIGA